MSQQTINPDYLAGAKKVLAAAPFFHLIGLELVDLSPGRAIIRLPAQEKHLNPFQRVHGSVGAAIIDATTFWAIFSQVEDGRSMTTAELNLNYLAPARPGMTLVGEGRAVKVGRSLGVAEARVVEAETDELIAFGKATCLILDSPPPRPLGGLPPKFLAD